MSDQMKEILEKVQRGEITPAEGERLLDELPGGFGADTGERRAGSGRNGTGNRKSRRLLRPRGHVQHNSR